ncbi:MAG: hypothetical protein LH472_15255 [Pyrinomonadaceae bacterium]|nr:hypothetical protein [Pyrinomonadaceae bacterium]
MTIWVCFVLVFVFFGEFSAQKNNGNKNRDLKKPTQTDGKPTTPTENTITKPDKKTESTKPDKTDTTPRKKNRGGFGF